MNLLKINLQKKSSALLILSVITIICLAGFVKKPFNVDETLFLWNAKQIQSDFTDFYGSTANWYGIDMQMYNITKNPPLTCYCISIIAFFFGWSEFALHIFFLLPAVGVSLGTYFLARKVCKNPIVATLAGIFTPVFFVSSSTIMCDTTMVAFWVWAIYLWIIGIEKSDFKVLTISAFLISLCSLTKYFGISLIPLLFVYTLVEKRRFDKSIYFLIIPIVILTGYQVYTHSIYGRGLLLDAASYATGARERYGVQNFFKTLTGLSFTGGSVASVLFFIPFLWSKRVLVIIGVIFVLAIFFMPYLEKIGGVSLTTGGKVKWGMVVQMCLFIFIGLNILCIVIYDLIKNRDSLALLFFLWIIGTYSFACFLNWSVNGRSILPMVPAVGILTIRQIEKRKFYSKFRSNLFIISLMFSCLVSFCVLTADHRWAKSVKEAAEKINAKYKTISGTKWFQGHWGFQYYMETGGAKAVNFGNVRIMPEDIVVFPSNNTNVYPFKEGVLQPVETINISPLKWLSTMNSSVGAGYYADVWGPLPYAFGHIPDEKYFIFELNKNYNKNPIQ